MECIFDLTSRNYKYTAKTIPLTFSRTLNIILSLGRYSGPGTTSQDKRPLQADRGPTEDGNDVDTAAARENRSVTTKTDRTTTGSMFRAVFFFGSD